MCSNSRTGTSAGVLGYTYPTLRKGARWYVDFYAFDPAIQQLRRKRYYISDKLSTAEKNRRASELIR